MIADDVVKLMAERLVEVSGVAGVLLGGGRARGPHDSAPAVDLNLYHRAELDTDAVGRLAVLFSGIGARVTRVGERGPWGDDGAWLIVDGTHVGWVYRDLDRLDQAWARAAAGDVEFRPLLGRPMGVPSFAYVGELALGTILADPDDQLRARKSSYAPLPPALADTLVRRLDEADVLLSVAEKAVARGDTAYIAGCLFHAVMIAAYALHGGAGSWVFDENGAIASAGLLWNAPEAFAMRAHGAIGALGVSSESLATSVADIRTLLAEVRATTAR